MSAAVPVLRFREFAGEWTLSRISSLGTLKSGSGFPDVEQGGVEGIPFFKVSDMNLAGNEDVMVRANNYVTLEQIERLRLKPMVESSIVFAKVGAAITLERKRQARNFLIDNNMMAFMPNESFDYDFATVYLRRITLSRFAQVGALPSYNASDIGIIPVYLPTLPEQQKVAAFLGAVDGRIAGLRRAEAGLVRFKAGLMQRLFSQKLRFTQDDGSAFPDWEKKRLGDVAEINPRTRNLPDEFFYIDLESVTAGTLSNPDWISLVGAPSRAQRLLTDGDVLFQMVRPYQRNNLHFKLSGQYVGSTGYAQLRARDDSEFLFQSLHEETFVNKVIERCTGTGYPSINSSDLAEILLPYPHPDEQRKIAAALSALDAKVEAISAQITKTERFKQGLLQQMFV